MNNRIRELRLKKGLTLKQLGAILGLAPNTISQYETGDRTPKFEIWSRMADFFDVSIAYLKGSNDISSSEFHFDNSEKLDIDKFIDFKFRNNHIDKIDFESIPHDTQKTIGNILRSFELDILDVLRAFIFSSSTLNAIKELEKSIDRSIMLVDLDSDEQERRNKEVKLMIGLYLAILSIEQTMTDEKTSKKRLSDVYALIKNAGIDITITGLENLKF
ncbi:helix-turn-helix domain-containing protein [Lactobacillus sp. AN1001]